jgi:hypothetical protein
MEEADMKTLLNTVLGKPRQRPLDSNHLKPHKYATDTRGMDLCSLSLSLLAQVGSEGRAVLPDP